VTGVLDRVRDPRNDGPVQDASSAAIARPSSKRILLVAGSVVAGGLIVWASGRGMAIGDLAGSLAGADWRLAALAGVAFMVQVLVQSAAWRIGMRAGGLGAVPMRHVVAATWIGKAGNALLPGQMGEVGRVLAVRRHISHENRCTARIVGSLVGQRIVAGAATFLIVATVGLFLPLPFTLPGGRASVGAAIAVMILGVLLGRSARARAWIVRLVPNRLRGVAGSVACGAGVLGCGRAASRALGLHVAGLVAQLAGVALLLQAFSLQVPLTAAVLIIAALSVGRALPAAPGGVGLTQAAIVLPLGAIYGVASGDALGFALGLEAIAVAVALLGGAAALAHQRLAPAAV